MATRPETQSKKPLTLLELIGILALISFGASFGLSYLDSSGDQVTILISNH